MTALNVWLVGSGKGGTRKNWLEIRECSSPKPNDYTYIVKEGKTEKRLKCELRTLVAGKRAPFSAGLVRTDLNLLISLHSWETREELDAALRGGSLVAHGWHKLMLLEIKDLREELEDA